MRDVNNSGEWNRKTCGIQKKSQDSMRRESRVNFDAPSRDSTQKTKAIFVVDGFLYVLRGRITE